MTKQPVYIVLIAFGKRGYGFAAYNLAKSLKHFNPDVFVHLLHDFKSIDQLTADEEKVFDKMYCLDKDYSKDPGKAKVSFYNDLIYDHALYLDVDALALQDITPLFETLSNKQGNFFTDVWGHGGYNDVIPYNLWAKIEDTYEVFGLDKETEKIHAVNTSFMFIKKCEQMKVFFDGLQENWNKFPLQKLKQRWGTTMPDELIFTGTMAQLKINPDAGIKRPVFFGQKIVADTYTKIAEDHYILSLFGNNTGQRLVRLVYLEWYDRLVKAYGFAKYNFRHIMPDKHLNNK